MTLTISKETVWKTSDGATHSSHAMAEFHVISTDLAEAIGVHHDIDGNDFLNIVSNHKNAIRAYLDAGERMERTSMGGPDT